MEERFHERKQQKLNNLLEELMEIFENEDLIVFCFQRRTCRKNS